MVAQKKLPNLNSRLNPSLCTGIQNNLTVPITCAGVSSLCYRLWKVLSCSQITWDIVVTMKTGKTLHCLRHGEHSLVHPVITDYPLCFAT